METIEKRSALAMMDEMTLRSVRAWWADGLWDFAIAGFFILLAVWFHYFVRLLYFPSWTWPWPFITTEPVNPLQNEILAFILSIVPVVALYVCLAYKVVSGLKSRLLAGRGGEVRHPFWMKVDPKIYIYYVLGVFGGLLPLLALFAIAKGALHALSLLLVIVPFAMLFVVGKVYRLPRYLVAARIGLALSLGVELLVTTNANYWVGPQGFLDVSPDWGDPAVPLVIWTVTLLVSGLVGLVATLRAGRSTHE